MFWDILSVSLQIRGQVWKFLGPTHPQEKVNAINAKLKAKGIDDPDSEQELEPELADTAMDVTSEEDTMGMKLLSCS